MRDTILEHNEDGLCACLFLQKAREGVNIIFKIVTILFIGPVLSVYDLHNKV